MSSAPRNMYKSPRTEGSDTARESRSNHAMQLASPPAYSLSPLDYRQPPSSSTQQHQTESWLASPETASTPLPSFTLNPRRGMRHGLPSPATAAFLSSPSPLSSTRPTPSYPAKVNQKILPCPWYHRPLRLSRPLRPLRMVSWKGGRQLRHRRRDVI